MMILSKWKHNDLLKNIPEIEKNFYKKFTYPLDLKKPNSFNSYIQSDKLKKANEKLWKFTDKYHVRKHIGKTIGKEYLIHLLGVWNNADEIDFKKLPSKFALKTTHGSSWNIIVRDINAIDIKNTRQIIQSWLDTNFYDLTLEPHYRRIKPRVIAEEYLEDGSSALLDYKFFCFHGKPYFLQVDFDRYTNHTRLVFNMNWQPLPFTLGRPNQIKLSQPPNFGKMVEIARKLAKKHTHIRVDLYNIYGRIVFGELTFTHESGLRPFNPESYDFLIGDIINKKVNLKLFNALFDSRISDNI